MLKDELKQLLDFAKQTDLQEVHWERNGITLSFKRSTPAARPNASSSAPTETDPSAETASTPKETLYIRSTMVGTFFRSDNASRPPMVVEGTTVAAGQAVGSIEAMKIRKDVLSSMSCRIVKALVTNNHAVEYGQPLFEVALVEDHV